MGKKWPRNGEKNRARGHFSPFLGHFFPNSGRGPFPIFFDQFFPISGSRPVCHSIPGGLTRNKSLKKFLPGLPAWSVKKSVKKVPQDLKKCQKRLDERQITICPETITELIRFEFLRCKNYVTAPKINSPEAQNRQKLLYANPSNPL